jgi:hypothetical protein
VVVHPGAEEADLGVGVAVASRQRGQVVVHLLLGQPRREVDLAIEPDRLGDVREQVIDRADADGAEHGLQVLLGDRRVSAQRSSL